MKEKSNAIAFSNAIYSFGIWIINLKVQTLLINVNGCLRLRIEL
jgi:hypothetical protein